MTQADDHWRTSDTLNGRVQNPFRFNSSKAETSPTFEQLLRRDGSKWSRISLHKQKKNNEQEDKQNHHKKMSVLAKVKERAKKLKLSLSGKNGHDEKDSTTRSSVVGPKDKGEEDAEYHSARMYDSKHPPASILKNHSGKSKDELASSSNTIAETQSKNQGPLETAKNDTKNKVTTTSDVPKVQESSDSNSRFLDLMVSTQESVASKSEEGQNKKRESQTRDRGVSVKEYLMHKSESGEDERGLSKVITQTLSPRRDKVREAMSSFLKNEEPSNQLKSTNADINVNLNFKSKLLPASTNLSANTAGLEIASIEQSHSLGSIATKPSSNLNQTFKSTFASYQVHFLGSNSNNNMKLNSSATSFSPNTNTRLNDSLARFHSPTKTSSTSLSLALSAHESHAPVSNAEQTRVPSHTVTSVRRVPVSSSVRTRIPYQTRVSGQINAHEDRFSVSTSDTGRSAI